MLSEDAALELGGPSAPSVGCLLWTREPWVEHGRVARVGPDLGEIESGPAPLARVLIASGDFDDPYDAYRDLTDALAGVALRGFMTRSLPTHGNLWCRVAEDAAGLSLAHLGAAYIDALRAVPGVRSVEALLVAGDAGAVRDLEPIAADARDTTRALLKLIEQGDHDCDTCDYQAICESVDELRALRETAHAREGGR